MKCGALFCEKEALKNRKYCSRDCAPCGNIPGDGPIPSEELMQRFTTRVNGGASARYAGEDKDTKTRASAQKREKDQIPSKENTISGTKRDFKMRSASTGMENHQSGEKNTIVNDMKKSKEIQNSKDRNNENTMQEVRDTISSALTPLESNAILPTCSAPIFVDTTVETLASLSLISDSTKHLFDLMKSSEITPREVCSCADQIHKLMRLKLDIVREARR